jgi:hypothetical protein
MGADTPASADLHDRVEVKLHQFVTTVSPKNGDLSLCKDVGIDSFEVWTPDERVVPIYSVDREGAVSITPGAGSAPAAKRAPIYIAFYLDLKSMGEYPNKTGPDNSAAFRADETVRQMLASDAFRASFKYDLGDRLLLALFDGSDVEFVTGPTSIDEFGKAFDAIETRTFHEQDHLDDRRRWSSLISFGEAFGNAGDTAGATKHVILLSGDFKLNAKTGELTMSNIASVLQRARVVIHPVDLLWSERVLPAGILTLSWLAQGELFGNGATALDAVEKVIGVYDNGCRLIVSVQSPVENLSLHLLDKRFTIPPAAPVRALPPLTMDERFEANLKLRFWGGGLLVESNFVPVKPLDKKAWRGYILTRIRIDPDGKFPDDVKDLEVLASLNDGQKPFSMSLGKADVDELRSCGSKLVRFEATVSAGNRSSLTVVTSPDLSVGATSRAVFIAPKPPRPGESVSWSLAGGGGSVGP